MVIVDAKFWGAMSLSDAGDMRCSAFFAQTGVVFSSRHWMRRLARPVTSIAGPRVRPRTSTLR
jgi:hypothetical protein